MGVLWKAIGTTMVLAGGAGLAVYIGEIRPTARKVAFTSEAIGALDPVRRFVEKNGKLPPTVQELGIKPHSEANLELGYPGKTIKVSRDYALTGDTVVVLFHGVSDQGPATLFFRFFTIPQGGVRWDCAGGTLEKKYRTEACRQ